MQPKVGEIWGNPSEPMTWILVDAVGVYGVTFQKFGSGSRQTKSLEEWDDYVETRKAINITERLKG